MKTHLPVPERALPPESARRIRATITADRLDDEERRPIRSWLVPLAAALVVIALMATAVVLWPNAARTEVAAAPSAVELSWTPTAVDAPTPNAQLPAPTTWFSADPTSGPTSPTDVFLTDRGPLSPDEEDALVTYCAGEAGSRDDGVTARYARRVTDGQVEMLVVRVRLPDGREWQCGPSSGGPRDRGGAAGGPTGRNPVIMGDVLQGVDQDGLTAEFEYEALAGVARVQARAVVRGRPKPWFEAEVHSDLAYLPMFNPGTFDWPVDEKGPRNVRYEHRAFDADGDEVAVKVLR